MADVEYHTTGFWNQCHQWNLVQLSSLIYSITPCWLCRASLLFYSLFWLLCGFIMHHRVCHLADTFFDIYSFVFFFLPLLIPISLLQEIYTSSRAVTHLIAGKGSCASSLETSSGCSLSSLTAGRLGRREMWKPQKQAE